jgi:hypothetical protein
MRLVQFTQDWEGYHTGRWQYFSEQDIEILAERGIVRTAEDAKNADPLPEQAFQNQPKTLPSIKGEIDRLLATRDPRRPSQHERINDKVRMLQKQIEGLELQERVLVNSIERWSKNGVSRKEFQALMEQDLFDVRLLQQSDDPQKQRLAKVRLKQWDDRAAETDANVKKWKLELATLRG